MLMAVEVLPRSRPGNDHPKPASPTGRVPDPRTGKINSPASGDHNVSAAFLLLRRADANGALLDDPDLRENGPASLKKFRKTWKALNERIGGITNKRPPLRIGSS